MSARNLLVTALIVVASCTTPYESSTDQSVGGLCPKYPPRYCDPSGDLSDEDWNCTLACQSEAGGGASAYCPPITLAEDQACETKCGYDWTNPDPVAYECTRQCIIAIRHQCIGGVEQ